MLHASRTDTGPLTGGHSRRAGGGVCVQASCALKKVTDVCVAAWRPENVTEPYGTWEVVGTLQLTGSELGVIANFTSFGDNTAHCNTTQALPGTPLPNLPIRHTTLPAATRF